jgi:hypothetical protein
MAMEPLKTPPSNAQPPTAMTKAGPGMASRAWRTVSGMLRAPPPVGQLHIGMAGLGVTDRP